MDNKKENREFITKYYNAMSGVIKTEKLCREYIKDESLIEHIVFFDGAFPEYELFIDEMIAEDDKVLTRAWLSGVHKGEFNGIPATNHKVEFPFVIRYTVANNKIIDHWLIADQIILMEQLGISQPKEKQTI